MSLLEECIAALGESCETLNTDESNLIFDLFQRDWPITSWGRINWDKIERKINIKSVADIRNSLEVTLHSESPERLVHILWDEGSLPVLKAELTNIINSIDDVTAVSFDTWLYNSSVGYVIEFYHEGQIMLGFQTT